MTHYEVLFYCNDEQSTGYVRTVGTTGGSCVGAANFVFGDSLPPMPKDIVGVIVLPTYFH
jgi:hypothetical protein